MGTKAKRREEFFKLNPKCCFCGGVRQAKEIDHVPSRVLFKNRQWPEGFEFPACSKCNRASALDEQVVAMLALVTANTPDSSMDAEIKARLQAIANNLPKLFLEMTPSASQLRQTARKYGLQPTPGQTHFDLPLLSVRGPLVNGSINSFARKLACALFYKHTGSIAPTQTPIAVRWYSNIQIDNDEIPRELASVLVNFPTLKRAGTSLQDQFFYRWGVSDTLSMAVFLAFFRESFAILMFVNTSKLEPGVSDAAHVVYPHEWPEG